MFLAQVVSFGKHKPRSCSLRDRLSLSLIPLPSAPIRAIHETEPVPLGVFHDYVVGVVRPVVPVHLAGVELDETADLGILILRVDIEVDARR